MSFSVQDKHVVVVGGGRSGMRRGRAAACRAARA